MYLPLPSFVNTIYRSSEVNKGKRGINFLQTFLQILHKTDQIIGGSQLTQIPLILMEQSKAPTIGQFSFYRLCINISIIIYFIDSIN